MVGTTLVTDPFILSPVATGARSFIPDTLTDYYMRTAKQLGIATHFHELRHFAATTVSVPVPTCGPWPAAWATRTPR